MEPVQGSQITRRTILGATGGAATLLALSACSFTGSDGSGEGKGGPKILNLAVSLPLNSFDPHFVNNGSYVSPSGLFEGLVSQDPSGKSVVPAIAEKWDVSGDGLEYTFHIRSNAKFSNGDPITAQDFVWTYQRLLTPTGANTSATTGSNSYRASLGIKGASDYLSGAQKDFSTVGVAALDPQKLKITLALPNAGFLMGLTHVSMMLLHPASVQKSATEWMQPANWVGSGPFALTEWSPTASASMKPHEHYWDRKAIKIDQVDVRVIGDAAAYLLAYRNNEVKVEKSEPATFGNDEALAKEYKSVPGYGVAIIQARFSYHPASRDARVRRAMSMAIDREKLSRIAPGSTPGTSLLPSSVPGYNDSIAIKYDASAAQALLATAGYPGGKGMPEIEMLVYSDEPSIPAVVDMWTTTLGLKCTVQTVDLGVFVATRDKPLTDPNKWGFTPTTFGSVPTMSSWVFDLWGPDVIPRLSIPAAQQVNYLAIQADTAIAPADKSARLKAIVDQYATPEALKFAKDAAAARATVDPNQQKDAFLAAARSREELCFQMPLTWRPSGYLIKPGVSNVNVLYAFHGFYFKGVEVS